MSELAVPLAEWRARVAVDGKGNKLAHVILSELVVSDKADPLIFLDSPEFLLAGVAN